MDELTKTIATRGDLAHLALFLWASGASGVLVWTLRELARANQRFEDFVKEIAALNRLFSSAPSDRSQTGSFDRPPFFSSAPSDRSQAGSFGRPPFKRRD